MVSEKLHYTIPVQTIDVKKDRLCGLFRGEVMITYPLQREP